MFNYDKEFSKILEYPVNENDVVFDFTFYLSIVHYNIVNNFNIPTILTLICNKENWVKK